MKLIYLNDVIIFDKTLEVNLWKILRLRAANLKINHKKYSFFNKKVRCLRHIISIVSEKGLTVD